MQAQWQAAGFPVGGEDLAVDLADTLITVTDPVTDLLADPERAARWWRLQAPRLPVGTAEQPPGGPALTRLRAAIRELLEARVQGRTQDAAAREDVNAASAAVPASTRLLASSTNPIRETRWHDEFGGDPALAAFARSAIDLLADPERAVRLRRCANPACSMLFVAENARRVWCTPNICGNRARVNRHYRAGRGDRDGTSSGE